MSCSQFYFCLIVYFPSLDCLFLGEMNLQSGSVRVAGSVAYCDQRPWILNTTVKVVHVLSMYKSIDVLS